MDIASGFPCRAWEADLPGDFKNSIQKKAKYTIMNVQEWGIVISVVSAAVLAIAPWMFKVHAKLAVLSTQVARLETKVDCMVNAEQDRLPHCIQHETALKELERRWEMHTLQIENLSDRFQGA
jgi:hypothetical protein